MFAKTKTKLINLEAVQKVHLSEDTLAFYAQDGSIHTWVNFPTPEEAERAFRLLALELKAKGQLLLALEGAE